MKAAKTYGTYEWTESERRLAGLDSTWYWVYFHGAAQISYVIEPFKVADNSEVTA